jgi:NADPH:quinone reductase
MTHMQAVRLDHCGGPDVMVLHPVTLAPPGPGDVLLRQTAIGLNFIDIYHRTGLYPVPLPAGLGLEAVGVVDAIGDGVTNVRVGDRVGYGWGPIGAYASHRLFPADRLVAIPDAISDEVAAAVLLKGATAECLAQRVARIQPGDTVLVHAAAGGVGLLLAQWLASMGAQVIGTAGSPAKAALARAHGCDHVIEYAHEDVAARVREITQGAGVAVVYDSVGRDTFMASLDSLRLRGLLVAFGNASGPVTGVDIGILAAKGSLYLTRPTVLHYYGTAAERTAGTAALFAKVSSGALKIRIDQRYRLADAAQAHDDLQNRRTTGASLLIP